MASGLSAVVVLALCVALAPCVSAGDDCKAYTDQSYTYHIPKTCSWGSFCCGSCYNRYCCSSRSIELSEDEQDDCYSGFSFRSSPMPMVMGIGISIIFVLIFICCCVCPCCCLYKMCRKPRPVMTTTTHTTVVTTTPQQYPQQPVATPAQPPGYQYSPYQATSVQPGYGSHPMHQGYAAQPMPTMPYQGQPYTAGPPPTYQEATGPVYPPNLMPYSQAAYTPGQTPYPLQPPAQPQPNAPPPNTDYLTQPAYNPDYVVSQPKTG